MKSLELFSGAGGLAKGLELSGFDHEAFVEFNKDACKSLRANFEPARVYEGDVRDFDFSALSSVDLVAGGPPCQPFSAAGKHKAHDDSRDMFPYAAKAIEALQPKGFIFENVKGLLRQSFKEYLEYIVLRLTFPGCTSKAGGEWVDHLRELRAINWKAYSGTKYRVSFKLLNAADFGIPQVRERVFIVGVRSDFQDPWEFPKPTHSMEALYWSQYVTKTYWQRHGLSAKLAAPISARLLSDLRSRYGLFAPDMSPWQTVRDALMGVPQPYEAHDISDHVFRDGARSYPGHTGSYIDLPGKTIKAGVHGVPGGENMIRFNDDSIRYLTVFEGKRLQTFPDDFIVTGAWGEAMRQIGNAVPVRLAEILGRQLIQLVGKQNAPAVKRKAAA